MTRQIEPSLKVSRCGNSNVEAHPIPIPDYQTLMEPVLHAVATSGPVRVKDLASPLAAQFGLSEQEVHELKPSGRGTFFESRIYWAATYMVQAGLPERPERGLVGMTAHGISALFESPARIDNGFLKRYEGFRNFLERSRRSQSSIGANAARSPPDTLANPTGGTPEEILEETWHGIRAQVADELLEKVKSASPDVLNS